jgi:hypothetical protein
MPRSGFKRGREVEGEESVVSTDGSTSIQSSSSAPRRMSSRTAAVIHRSNQLSTMDQSDRELMAALQASMQPLPSTSSNHPPPQLNSPPHSTPVSHSHLTQSSIRHYRADELSVIFSYLNSIDFLSAICVSHDWFNVRVKHTAWPAFRLNQFIQSLRDGDYDNPARRRLHLPMTKKTEVLHSLQLLGSDTSMTLETDMDVDALPPISMGSSLMWRHATDVKLCFQKGGTASYLEDGVPEMLKRIGLIPYLSALNFVNLQYTCAELVHSMYSQLNIRLQALLLFDCSLDYYQLISVLTNLRVLVFNSTSLASHSVLARALTSLTQLEHIHINSPSPLDGDDELGYVLRWLSSEHALRSFSYGRGGNSNDPGLDRLFAPPSTIPSHAHKLIGADLPLVDWNKPCQLTDVSLMNRISRNQLQSLFELPRLWRVQLVSAGRIVWLEHIHIFPPLRIDALTHLREFKISDQFPGNYIRQVHWGHIAHCTQLERIHISLGGIYSSETLMSALLGSASTLTEIHIDSAWKIQGEANESVTEPINSSHFANQAMVRQAVVEEEMKWKFNRDHAKILLAQIQHTYNGHSTNVNVPVQTGTANLIPTPLSTAASLHTFSHIQGNILTPWSLLTHFIQLKCMSIPLMSINNHSAVSIICALSTLPSFDSLRLIVSANSNYLPVSLHV